MRGSSLISRILFVTVAIVLASCGSDRRPQSAKEFVERFSAAWKSEDVDAILSMQYDLKKFDKTKIPLGKELQALEFIQEDKRARVAKDIAEKGFGYRAGSELEYVSEQEHGDHIHVRVTVGAARTDIVLLRDEGSLKMFPFPSWIN
jgi:hypothetical protein